MSAQPTSSIEPTSALNIQDFIDTQPRTSGTQRWVWALCFAIVLLDGIDTAAVGYIAPALMQQWGIERAALAPVLSAALFGVAAGALAAGPLADWLGRRRVLLASVVIFGAASIASSMVESLQQLSAWRFVTGLGLGAAMPAAVTLVNEYSPSRRRAMVTNMIFCGFSFGAAVGGWVSAALIPAWGWRSVLFAGGAAPLALLVLLMWKLPESVRHMARTQQHDALRRVLTSMASSAQQRSHIAQVQSFVVGHEPGGSAVQPSTSQTPDRSMGPKQLGWALLLDARYRLGTLCLWVAYFMGLVIFYALINWLPVLLMDAGMAAQRSALMTSLFPLGGVGAIALGWVMDRFNPTRALAVGYAATALAIWALAASMGAHTALIVLALLIAGVVMNTTQASMPALAAAWYPTACRATGVAWMLGMGRFGGIAGALLVAQFSAWTLSLPSILALIGVAGLIASLAMWVKDWADRHTTGHDLIHSARQHTNSTLPR